MKKKILIAALLLAATVLSSCGNMVDGDTDTVKTVETTGIQTTDTAEATERSNSETTETAEAPADTQNTGTDAETTSADDEASEKFISETDAEKLVDSYAARIIEAYDSYLNNGSAFRRDAGSYCISDIFEEKKLEVYTYAAECTNQSPGKSLYKTSYNSMPMIYYWIKYLEISEEDFRAKEKLKRAEAMENIVSHGDKYGVPGVLDSFLLELLSDEDITILYHGTEYEIKQQFRLPFSYMDADGQLIPVNTMAEWILKGVQTDSGVEQLSQEVIDDYRNQLLEDLTNYFSYYSVLKLMPYGSSYYSSPYKEYSIADVINFVVGGELEGKSGN